MVSRNTSYRRCKIAYLVPHERLLNHGEVLQRRQQHVAVLRSTHVLDEAAQLVAQGGEDFILVLDRLYICVSSQVICPSCASRNHTVEEGYQLISRALRPERERDRGQSPDCVESQKNVIVLYGEVSALQTLLHPCFLLLLLLMGEHAHLQLIDQDGDGV